MLEAYEKEFMAITEFCLDKGKKTLKFLVVEKKLIVDMLDHNKYDTATNKLKIWKGLNWIDTDEKKLTKRRYDKKTGTYKTCVFIYLKVFETMKKLEHGK